MNHIFLRGAAASFLACATVAFAAPPVAPVRDTVEMLHGVTVHDPYRYFENLKDPEVQAWLKAQGDYARETLDAIPGRDALLERITQLSNTTGDVVYGVQRVVGRRVFYMRRVQGEKQAKLMMRDGASDRVLVDPQVESGKTGVPHAVNWFVPSWNGRYVAYGMSAGGSEDTSLFILDVASGERIGEPVPRVHEDLVGWAPDSRSLTYNQLRRLGPEDAESEFYLDSRVMWLKVGAPESEARPVFGPTVTKQLGLARLDVGSITFAPGSPWMIARTTDTTLPEGKLFVARVDELGAGEVHWKPIANFDDRIVDIELKGDLLYFRTHKDAPRFKVMALDLRDPRLAKARTVALPPAGGVIEGFQVGARELMAQVREGTAIGLRRYDGRNARGRPVKLPFAGAAGLATDAAHAHTDWILRLSGWTRPPQMLRLAGDVARDAGFGATRVPPGVPELQVTDVKVRSWDGTLVPMTIVHRKGLKLDASHPTLLEGYASYGFSETAHFDPATYAWFERGGVIAYANVRGSGVYGDDWRYAGFKATKPNTWKDGVACARYLVTHGYASPKTMGVWGASAGGIFIGRVVTSAPQLFAAGVSEVGVMDAVRAEESANGITNISEFGSYKDPKEFPALLEMSTYHQVRDGTPYPAMLFVQGLNDPRVDAWQSAKGAARFAAATSSGKPVLLRLDAQAGHGMGSTATQRQQVRADIYAFLLWQMGQAGAH